MNTENTFTRIVEMTASESYFRNLVDFIDDMDLELMEITL